MAEATMGVFGVLMMLLFTGLITWGYYWIFRLAVRHGLRDVLNSTDNLSPTGCFERWLRHILCSRRVNPDAPDH